MDIPIPSLSIFFWNAFCHTVQKCTRIAINHYEKQHVPKMQYRDCLPNQPRFPRHGGRHRKQKVKGKFRAWARIPVALQGMPGFSNGDAHHFPQEFRLPLDHGTSREQQNVGVVQEIPGLRLLHARSGNDAARRGRGTGQRIGTSFFWGLLLLLHMRACTTLTPIPCLVLVSVEELHILECKRLAPFVSQVSQALALILGVEEKQPLFLNAHSYFFFLWLDCVYVCLNID